MLSKSELKIRSALASVLNLILFLMQSILIIKPTIEY